MKPIYHRSLPLLITGSTGKQVACQVGYLKIKNEFLRLKLRFPQSASVRCPYAIYPMRGDAPNGA